MSDNTPQEVQEYAAWNAVEYWPNENDFGYTFSDGTRWDRLKGFVRPNPFGQDPWPQEPERPVTDADEEQEIQDAKADAERRLVRRSRRYTWIALVLVFLVTGVLAGLGGYYVGYDQGHEQGVRHTNQVWLDSWNQYHQAPDVPAPAPTTDEGLDA